MGLAFLFFGTLFWLRVLDGGGARPPILIAPTHCDERSRQPQEHSESNHGMHRAFGVGAPFPDSSFSIASLLAARRRRIQGVVLAIGRLIRFLLREEQSFHELIDEAGG